MRMRLMTYLLLHSLTRVIAAWGVGHGLILMFDEPTKILTRAVTGSRNTETFDLKGHRYGVGCMHAPQRASHIAHA